MAVSHKGNELLNESRIGTVESYALRRLREEHYCFALEDIQSLVVQLGRP